VEAKAAVEAKVAGKAVMLTGRVEPVIHRVGAEGTIRHQRSRTDKGNQRGAPPNRGKALRPAGEAYGTHLRLSEPRFAAWRSWGRSGIRALLPV